MQAVGPLDVALVLGAVGAKRNVRAVPVAAGPFLNIVRRGNLGGAFSRSSAVKVFHFRGRGDSLFPVGPLSRLRVRMRLLRNLWWRSLLHLSMRGLKLLGGQRRRTVIQVGGLSLWGPLRRLVGRWFLRGAGVPFRRGRGGGPVGRPLESGSVPVVGASAPSSGSVPVAGASAPSSAAGRTAGASGRVPEAGRPPGPQRPAPGERIGLTDGLPGGSSGPVGSIDPFGVLGGVMDVEDEDLSSTEGVSSNSPKGAKVGRIVC